MPGEAWPPSLSIPQGWQCAKAAPGPGPVRQHPGIMVHCRGVETIRLMPGAAPFYLPGGETGCLLLHGLTGTPHCLRWLGEYLNGRGYTVYAPLLAGHGARPAALRGVRWPHWMADALAGAHLLRERCARVIPVGFSMGGALALLLAADLPDLPGVVAIAAPNGLHQRGRRLLPVMARSSGERRKGPESPARRAFQQAVRSYQSACGDEPLGYISYGTYPYSAVHQMAQLLRVMRARLPAITCPTLLIYSRQDDVIPIRNLEQNLALLRQAPTQTLILERSLHIIPQDCERQTVFEAVAAFAANRQGLCSESSDAITSS